MDSGKTTGLNIMLRAKTHKRPGDQNTSIHRIKHQGALLPVLKNETPEDAGTSSCWKMGDNGVLQNEWDEFFAENWLQNCYKTLASKKYGPINR